MSTNLRSAALQSLYFAQYMQNVQGDVHYIKAIIKFYVMTDSGYQPLVATIRDFATKHEANILNECWNGYQAHSTLVNAWLNNTKQ